MKKTFLLNSDLRSATFLGTPASARGYWVALQAYCSERESGGVIEEARKFSSKHWSMIMGGGGLRALESLIKANLARWSGDNLILSLYDLDSEASYRERRARASLGGRVKAAKDREKRDHFEPGELSGVSSSSGTAVATASGSGRQGEGSDGRVGVRSVEERGALGRSEIDPTRSPQNEGEAIALFKALFNKHTGGLYPATPADSMAMRSTWGELDPGELPERMATFLEGCSPREATIGAFLGWYRGRANATEGSRRHSHPRGSHEPR